MEKIEPQYASYEDIVDSFDAEYVEEPEENPNEEPQQEEPETEAPEQVEEPAEEAPEPEEPEQPAINDPDADKRNRAFADMRRQNEELQKQLEDNKRYADIIKAAAEQNGITPDDVLRQYQEKQLQREAEKEGVSPEVLKRLRSLETENSQMKEQTTLREFNSAIAETVAKHSLKDEDVTRVFEYAADNGIDFRTNPRSFEYVYKAAFMDEIVEREIAKRQQSDLENKRKRQTTSAVPAGKSVEPLGDDMDEQVKADVAKMLADF